MKVEKRFFGGAGKARDVIASSLRGATFVRIATAYFELSGFECLKDELAEKEIRLLIGRPDSGSGSIEDILRTFFETLTSGSVEERSLVMKQVYDALLEKRFSLSLSQNPEVLASPKYLYQHAKLYIADRKNAVVSSANMTRHGLVQSREAGIVVDDADDVAFFADTFDRYYEEAVAVGDEFLEQIGMWLVIQDPFIIYARSLLLLYGLPENDAPATLPPLAPYQRPVVSRMLHTISDYGGCFLIASTGLGKTIMAAHLIALLRMASTVDNVLVFCPAGLRRMWRRTIRAARASGAEFSYHTLSTDDWRRFSAVEELEDDLAYANEQTLIVLDESHHMRNRLSKSELRLRNRRVHDAVSRGAKVLLMTATPYSTGVDDINAQLALLPSTMRSDSLFTDEALVSWHVDQITEVTDLAVCSVLATPSVVRHFGHENSEGGRYVIFSHKELRYFPTTIHLKNINYHNPFNTLLAELLADKYLYTETNHNRESLPSLFEHESRGTRDPLLESRVIHQFCSSAAEVELFFDKLSRVDGFEKVRFANRKKIDAFLLRHSSYVSRVLADYSHDEKLTKLCSLLERHQHAKIVVFCVYRKTSRYVAESLQELFPNKNIQSTVDKSADELESLVKTFAPFANRIGIADADQTNELEDCDVLVATGAVTEGFNLQDASVLINFDLPWTVLVLAQRMGRILRPWHEEREIYIYNMLPDTMSLDEIHIARNWKKRLHTKGSEFRSFAEIPVVVERGAALEMVELANQMNSFDEVDLAVDDVIEFIENCGEVKTTSFLDDLAGIAENEIAECRKLPSGIRTFKKAPVKSRMLYLLLSWHSRVFAALFSEDSSIVLDNSRMDEIMQLLRCSRDEEAYAENYKASQIDEWINSAIAVWARSRELPSEEIVLECYAVLYPA